MENKHEVTPIKRWYHKVVSSSHCGTPVFDGWDKHLWSKPYSEIVDFLISRFRTTLSESEYYFCILYLDKHIEKEMLYAPFKQSPQYQDMLKNKTKGVNPLPSPMALKQMPFSMKTSMFSIKVNR